MIAHTDAGGIENILADERENLAAFVALIRQEQDHLIEGHVDELPTLGLEKRVLAERIAALTERRNQALFREGYSRDRRGIEMWLARHGAKTAAAENWRAIAALAEGGRTLNQTNGILIEARLKYTEHALNVLLGSTVDAPLYGRDGQARGAARAREIATG